MTEEVIIFGGTFDPIHTAHLMLAEAAACELGVTRVLFIPSRQPPHKSTSRLTDAEDRAAMVSLAIDGNPLFEISRVELERKGSSFAIDTIRQIARERSILRPYYLVGFDSLVDLAHWRSPEKIMEESRVVVAPRPGFEPGLVDDRFRQKYRLLDSPQFTLSATAIRERVRREESIRYLTPEPVRHFIDERKLYRPGTGGLNRGSG